MNRIDRLFGILTLLQSKQYVSAEKISDQFAISIRTVYRDVKALAESGIPVSFEPHKGYFVVQGYFLPPVAFTTEEANALMISESLIAGFSDKTTQAHFATALAKVKTVLKATQKVKVEHLGASIRMQLPQCFSNDFNFLSTIQEAITSAIQLELHYTNVKQEISCRSIEPIGLVYYALSWHVIAWCHLRGEYRDFKIARIAKLAVTGKAFAKENHIALGEYQLPVDY